MNTRGLFYFLFHAEPPLIMDFHSGDVNEGPENHLVLEQWFPCLPKAASPSPGGPGARQYHYVHTFCMTFLL